MHILVCQWMCTLLYYTYRYMLIRRAKNFSVTIYRPNPSPLLDLSPISISCSLPYCWHLWPLQCRAAPQLQWARLRSLGEATAWHWEHSDTHHSGVEQETGIETFFPAESLVCVSAPVRWPSPYFSGFASSMNQLSIKELSKKQNWITATSATVEPTLEFNWKKTHANHGEWFFLGHTALNARGTETSLIN